MRLIGRDVLARAASRHREASGWLRAWSSTVEDADWHSLDDVQSDYPSADGVKLRSRIIVTVFNVKGNTYRLLASINYRSASGLVLKLLTHAEYDKEKWKDRY